MCVLPRCISAPTLAIVHIAAASASAANRSQRATRWRVTVESTRARNLTSVRHAAARRLSRRPVTFRNTCAHIQVCHLLTIVLLLIPVIVYGAVILSYSHCKSSFSEYRLISHLQVGVSTNPQTKSNKLGCESAGRLLPSTFTIAIYLY